MCPLASLKIVFDQVEALGGSIGVEWQILPEGQLQLIQQVYEVKATCQEPFTPQFLTSEQLQLYPAQIAQLAQWQPLNPSQEQAQQKPLPTQLPVAPPSGLLLPQNPKQVVPAAILAAVQLGDVSHMGKEYYLHCYL